MSVTAIATKQKAIEIHFGTTPIDHPVVEVRWCLSPETLAYMKRHPHKDWALVIVAQKPGVRDEESGVTYTGNPRHETRLVVEGIRAIGIGFGYMTFHAPDAHEVVAHLVSNFGTSDKDRKEFWSQVREFAKRKNHYYTESFKLLTSDDVPERFNESTSKSVDAYAADHVRVTIPDGIFAKPMSPWAKKLLSRYDLGVGEDECAGRWRLWLAVVFMCLEPFVRFIIFVYARLVLFTLGVLHFLVGGNPLVPWKIMWTWETIPDDWRTFWLKEEYERIPLFKGARALFVPLVLLIIGAFAYLGFQLVSALAGWVTLIVFTAVLTVLYFSDKIDAHLKQTATVTTIDTRTRITLADIAFVEKYAVCGEETRKGPRSFALAFSGVKRLVCKPRSL